MLVNFIYFILVLGVAVLIHELGHFIFAKRAGIFCYEFAIGMGPKLISKKYGETVYSIRAIPIGGYVSMAGEGVEGDKDLPKDRLFQSKTWGQRFMTIFAGPLFNFILSIVILFFIALTVGLPSNYLGAVNKDYPAQMAGLQVGDQIISINGEKTEDWTAISEILSTNGDKNIVVEYKRGSEVQQVTVTPKLDETTSNSEVKRYLIGISPDERPVGILSALKYGVTRTVLFIKEMFHVLGMLFSGAVGVKDMAGPVGIYRAIGPVAKSGIANLLIFTAFLSVNLGFMNLLPIPALDGGRIIFLLVELVRRKPVDTELENKINIVGFALLMALFVFITFNDILRIFQ